MRLGALLLSLTWLLVASKVVAQSVSSDPTARADELFSRGKATLAAGDISAACQMFGESYQLAPGTGGLLALAMCHEREGKLASALVEYQRLLDSADPRTRPDRVAAARDRVQALQPIVSTLVIDVKAQSPGVELQIRVNDQQLSASQIERPFPVDGGLVRLVASAPQTRPFVTEFTIATSGASQVVPVPRLEIPADVVAIKQIPVVRPAVAKAPLVTSTGDSSPVRWSARDWVGVGALGAGILTLGAGGILTLGTVHDHHVAESGCNSQGCVAEPADKPLRLESAEKAALIAGAALTVTGCSLLLLRLRPSRPERSAAQLRATPWLTFAAAGVAFDARF